MSSADISLLERAQNLFEFLANVQQLRERPVFTADRYEDVFWFADLPDDAAVMWPHLGEPDPEAPYLTVDRAPRATPPKLPKRLRPWLLGDIEDPEATLEMAESIPADPSDDSDDEIYFDDDPNLLELWDAFTPLWVAWAEQASANDPLRALYARIFSAYQTAQAHSETHELCLGVGCASWRYGGTTIKRHLLTFPVTANFDDRSGRITITRGTSNQPARLELDMLDPGVLLNAPHLDELRDEITEYGAHALDAAAIESALTPLAHSLDAGGSYTYSFDALPAANDLRVSFAPALILRKRSQRGLIEIYNTIQSQLAAAGEVPQSLVPLVDPDTRLAAVLDETPGGIVDIDGETFLALEVNERQLAVIDAVNTKAQVAVQGPPGTGKTHTAAALLTHLLAQGKRVLVTAQTDRALKELRDKLPAEIQPLSVSVVGNSREEMAELRVAVETISTKADELTSSASQRAIRKALDKIEALRSERADLYVALRDARQAETEERQVGVYQGTLSAIAQRINQDEAKYNWLERAAKSSIRDEVPITNSEAVEWFNLATDPILASNEAASTARLTDLESLPTPDEFAGWVRAEADMASHVEGSIDLEAGDLFKQIESLEASQREQLRSTVDELNLAFGDAAYRGDGWIREAISDIRSGRRSTWQARAGQVSSLINDAQVWVMSLGNKTLIEAPRDELPQLGSIAQALTAHLSGGGHIKVDAAGQPKIGALTPRIVKESRSLFATVTVNGLPPTTMEQLGAFQYFVGGCAVLNALDRAWPLNITIPEEDTLNERLQWHVAEHAQLMRVLALADVLANAERWVKTLGLVAPDWADLDDVHLYVGTVDAVTNRENLRAAQSKFDDLKKQFPRRSPDSSETTELLAAATADRDAVSYETHYAKLVHLHQCRDKIARRNALASSLDASSTGLSRALLTAAEEPNWRGELGHLSEAWKWSTSRDALAAIETTDVNALNRQLDKVDRRIRKAIQSLSAERAWSHAVSDDRMSGSAKAHLRQYAGLVRRLGKGTGKYAAKQRLEIREALDHCRPSVPVWIMPIYRIAEQFRVESNMFDVVIVDEASQAGVEASFLQYLAPKLVVIGDDKQVSPSAVGVNQQQIRDLADQYIPHDKFKSTWQDPKRSYFDEAVMRFGGKITLVEHRRSVPSIIGFSNRIAYEPDNVRLVPVRQPSPQGLPPLRTVHVRNGFKKGDTNPAEAEAIVHQILHCLDDPAYEGMTFGVIALTGSDQSRLIESLLLDALPAEVWTQRDLRCGTPPDFQGSERDVVFLSMVTALEPGSRLASLTLDTYVQRYNVAASRAKDQMWLFHSITPSDLNSRDDMRFALLDYMLRPGSHEFDSGAALASAAVPEDVIVEPFGSLFEQQVFNKIQSRGYSVIPQFDVEGYPLDLVVMGSNGRVAVECDGADWDGPDAHTREVARQRDLERCGWTFFRVRESSYYLDPEACLAGLWDLLGDPGSYTSNTISEVYESEVGPELIEVGNDPEHSVLEDDAEYEELQEDALLYETVEHSLEAAPEDGMLVHTPQFNFNAYAPTYDTFHGELVAVAHASQQQLIDGILKIVEAEGPVRGSRLLSAYVYASGGQRATGPTVREISRAVAAAVRRGLLVQDDPLSQAGVERRTYRVVHQPEYLVRPLGPRSLNDVPPLELATRIYIERLRFGNRDVDFIYHEVLSSLGLQRLTASARNALSAAEPLTHRFTSRAAPTSDEPTDNTIQPQVTAAPAGRVDKTTLTDDQVEELLDELRRRIARSSENVSRLQAEVHSPMTPKQREQQLTMLSAETDNLMELNSAAQRASRPDFGRCENCQNPISFERLMIRPQARLCMKCSRVPGSG